MQIVTPGTFSSVCYLSVDFHRHISQVLNSIYIYPIRIHTQAANNKRKTSAMASSPVVSTLDSEIPSSEIPSDIANATDADGDKGTLEVDSALKAAMRDTRERVALLRLEGALIDFCKSDAGWMEVGGPGNSVLVGPSKPSGNNSGMGRQTTFQRCILHRLADRFQIVRENGLLLEGSIRLIKVPDTAIPSQLLQDLEPSAYAEGEDGLSNAVSTVSLEAPRKMKIMKRNDRNRSGSLRDRKDLTPTGLLRTANASVSDKEKAYAEARARIFCDDSDSGSLASPSQPISPAANAASPAAVESPSLPAASDSCVFTPSKLDGSLESKAVYRNRLEEATDPDFHRGVMVHPYYPTVPAPVPIFVAPPTQLYPQQYSLAPDAPAFYPRSQKDQQTTNPLPQR